MKVNQPAYLAARSLLRFKLKIALPLLKGFRVVGGERLPRRPRPLILACNHAAFVDSVYLIVAVPARFTICGARPTLFRTATLRAAMALANILKVEDHDQFRADTAALLAAGETLLIYPEMGRNASGLGDFKPWAAEVALAAGVPLLPCYLYGTTRGHVGPPKLVVGEELAPEGDADALTRRLRRAILALAPAAASVSSAEAS
jgi:1-acyl-sn-glycerol-3-phosphate acyltransferase